MPPVLVSVSMVWCADDATINCQCKCLCYGVQTVSVSVLWCADDAIINYQCKCLCCGVQTTPRLTVSVSVCAMVCSQCKCLCCGVQTMPEMLPATGGDGSLQHNLPPLHFAGWYLPSRQYKCSYTLYSEFYPLPYSSK